MLRLVLGLLTAALACAFPAGVRGTERVPEWPMTMVVPAPSRRYRNFLCRFAAGKASLILGQPIVVENRAGGAGGRVGTESVLRSPPNGYTVLALLNSPTASPDLIFGKAGFDTRAMSPISVLATYPLIVLARLACRPSNMRTFIAHARPYPGKINYGHQGKAIRDTCSANR